MMTYGTQPTSDTSILTGESLKVYNNLVSTGYAKGETALSTTIDGTTYTEKESDRANRVFGDKKLAWSIAKAHVEETTNNGSVSITGQQLITTYVAGVGTNGETLVASAYPCAGTVMTPSTTQLQGNIS